MTTTNGAQMYDVMSGSLVNASSSVRYTTLSKASAGMKEQRAEFKTDMIASAAGVDNVEQVAHAALEKQMPKEVDYAIEVAEKVIAHLVPAINPNVQKIVRELDLAAIGVTGIPSIANSAVQSIKTSLQATMSAHCSTFWATRPSCTTLSQMYVALWRE